MDGDLCDVDDGTFHGLHDDDDYIDMSLIQTQAIHVNAMWSMMINQLTNQSRKYDMLKLLFFVCACGYFIR